MEDANKLFQELVIQFFKSRGYTVQWLNEEAGVLELREQDLDRGSGRAVRAAIITADTIRNLKHIPPDLDFLIRNDSPSGMEGKTRLQVGIEGDTKTNSRLNRRLGHLRMYDFGRDILFRKCGGWIKRQLEDARRTPLDTQIPDAHLLMDPDLETAESGGQRVNWLHNSGRCHDLLELISCRALVCGNRRQDITLLLEHHRLDILSELESTHPAWINSDEVSSLHLDLAVGNIEAPLLLPISLSAYKVRTQGFLETLRESLPPNVAESISDEALHHALRLRYIMVFIDHAEDWSTDYDLDPNRGALVDVLGNVGKSGAFVLGCDKALVFHFVCSDLLQKEDIRTYTKTLGERFLKDPTLNLIVLHEIGEGGPPFKDDKDGLRDDIEHPLIGRDIVLFQNKELLLNQSRGLLGEEEWWLLIRNIGLRLYSTDSPGYLTLAEMRQEIERVLPDNRTLKSNTDHIARVLSECGIFQVDPALGVRFRNPDWAEDVIAEGLRHGMEDLFFLGETHTEEGKFPLADEYLQAFVQFLTLPQMNDRIMYRAMREFGGGTNGYERCKQLWGANLMRVFAEGKYLANSDAVALPALRCSLLRMANILQAWIHRAAYGAESGTWSAFVFPPALPRIEARQLYLHGFDLKNANISASALPFVTFEHCALAGANFGYSYLISAYFKDCSMERVNFEAADLSGSLIEGGMGIDPQSFKGTGLWALQFEIGGMSEVSMDLSAFREKAGISNSRFIIKKEFLTAESDTLPNDPEFVEALFATAHFNSGRASPARGTTGSIWRYPPFWLKFQQEHGTLEVGIFNSDLPNEHIENVAAFDAIPGTTADSLIVAVMLRKGDICLLHVSKDEPFDRTPMSRPILGMQLGTDFMHAAVRLTEDKKGLVACWFPEEMAFAEFGQTLDISDQGANVYSTNFRQIPERLHSVLPALIGQKKYFILGGTDGGLHVFTPGKDMGDDVHQSSQRIPLVRQSSNEDSGSSPVSLDFIPRHGQILVARNDSSFDVYYLDTSGTLLKQTSFLLAHEHIHTIVTDPMSDKYLIMGVSKAPEGRLERGVDGESEIPVPADFETLVALCNTSFEVLHVWPVKPYSEEYLIREMEQNQMITGNARSSKLEKFFEQAEYPRFLKELLGTFSCKECKVLGQADSVRLKYSVSYDTGRAEAFGQEAPLSIIATRVGIERNYLSYSFSVKHLPTGTERFVPMSAVEVRHDSKNGLLEFQFAHPFFEKRGRRFQSHEVTASFTYRNPLSESCSSPPRSPSYSTETVHTMDTQPVRLERINPFHFGPAVFGKGSFFGFEQEIKEWAARLLQPQETLTITGARRMGKSSFGEELARTLVKEKNVLIVRLNVQPHFADQTLLFSSIVNALPDALREKHLPEVDVSELQALCSSTVGTLLNGVIHFLERFQIKKPILVLKLEEVGFIYDIEKGDAPFSPQHTMFTKESYSNANKFFTTLLELYEYSCFHDIELRFILIGLPWHFRLPVDLASHSGVTRYFYKPGRIYHVGQFTNELVDEMIQKKLYAQDMNIENEAVSYCRELSSNVPNDVQMIMHWAFERWQERTRNVPGVKPEICLDDIKGIVESGLIDHYNQYRDMIWPRLDEKVKAWVTNELMKKEPKKPAWEDNGIDCFLFTDADLSKFIEMGYWTSLAVKDPDTTIRKLKQILFIPKGLTMSLRNYL